MTEIPHPCHGCRHLFYHWRGLHPSWRCVKYRTVAEARCVDFTEMK